MPFPNRQKGRTCRYLAIVLCGIAAATGLWFAWPQAPAPDPPERETKIPPVPEISRPRFQNVSGNVQYVGTEQCAACHQAEFASYQKTTHSRSLQGINLDDEPPDGEIFHEASGRWYRAERQGDGIHHQELLKLADSEEVLLADHRLKFLVGSGHHTRSYLIEDDGFLIQSPLTWYTSRAEWGMSPGEGYLGAEHWAFERPVDERCLFCHTGQAKRIGRAAARLEFSSMAIDCERCHGPGELHIEKWAAGGSLTAGEIDETIVNPRKLSRDRQIDVCAQCHQSGSASAPVRGRSLDDFLPGLLLRDFVISYELHPPDPDMRVVGHVDQMRLSKCFQKSDSMTCLTCHNPHAEANPVSKADRQRQQCLSCHVTQSCKQPQHLRDEKSDNCVSCHMPEAPTADIPHLAFTHHRIGIHKAGQPKSNTSPRTLRPAVDNSHLAKLDQDRCLGLAYLAVSDQTASRDTARVHLEGVVSQGLRDGEVEAGLALCYRHSDPARSIEYAKAALNREDLPANTRINVLWLAGSASFDLGKIEQATGFLEELRRLNRNSQANLLLDACYEKQGRFEDSFAAAKRAVRISPWRADLQVRLSSLYQRSGQTALAEKHARLADLLRKASKNSPP